MTTQPDTKPAASWPKLRVVAFCLCLFVGGVSVGLTWQFGSQSESSNGIVLNAEALTSLATPTAAETRQGDYSFFTYRRNLWVVRHSTGTARFFVIPETNTSEQRIEASNTYRINQEEFPVDQVRYQMSERNLSNYLWITNPTSGRSYFIRARRDGGFDESPIAESGLGD